MQKFVDRHGRAWIVDIDNTTLRRVKPLTGVRLLDTVDGDLIPQMTQDVLLLVEVLFTAAAGFAAMKVAATGVGTAMIALKGITLGLSIASKTMASSWIILRTVGTGIKAIFLGLVAVKKINIALARVYAAVTGGMPGAFGLLTGAIKQTVLFGTLPHHCRCTPGVLSPFLTSLVSSMMPTVLDVTRSSRTT